MKKFVVLGVLALSLVSARVEASDYDPQIARALEGTYSAVGCTYVGKGQSQCGAVSQVVFKVFAMPSRTFLLMSITGPGGSGGIGTLPLQSETLIIGQGGTHDEVEYLRPTANTALVLASSRHFSSVDEGSFRFNTSVKAKGANVVVTLDVTSSKELGGADTEHYTYVIFGTRQR